MQRDLRMQRKIKRRLIETEANRIVNLLLLLNENEDEGTRDEVSRRTRYSHGCSHRSIWTHFLSLSLSLSLSLFLFGSWSSVCMDVYVYVYVYVREDFLER